MRLHLISNSIWVNSGFGKVARYLALGLKKLGHEVTTTGIQTALRTDYYDNIPIYPIDTGGHVDESGQLFLNIQHLKPDVLLYVGQTDADMNYVTKIFDKQVIYCPVEGQNIPDLMAADLKSVVLRGGRVIAQCQYGYNEMKKAGVDAHGYIYHGIDPTVFYPIQNFKINGTEVSKVSMLKLIRDEEGNAKWQQYDINIAELISGMKGKFIYGFVGNNFGLRKQIPRLLKAYAMLIGENRQIKDRSVLALHTLPISIRGVNLIKVVHQLGIQDNVIFGYSSFGSAGWSEEEMNIWYNLCDVNVSASSSEGFGMATLESMACGVANIGPNCSSFIELIGNGENARGLLADIATYHQIQDGSERALVDEYDLAEKMKIAYVDKDKMKLFEKNAIKFAGNYTWDKIVGQFDDVIREMKSMK